MDLITFKLLAAVTIFFAAFVVGLLPAAFSEKHPKTVFLSEAIASGIFLGAALFHMLPDAENVFRAMGLTRYPYAIFICVIAFLVLAAIEQSSKMLGQKTASAMRSLLLITILSIHSVIAGAALGINETLTNAVVIFIAIIAHKSCESFSLVVSLKRNFDNHRTVLLLLVFFSLMTPVGIILASSVMSSLQTHSAQLLEAILNALTAGTFLYIGTLDSYGRQMQPERLINRFAEFTGLVAGMIMMGTIAFWV